jgi:ferredoxin-NADP reductase
LPYAVQIEGPFGSMTLPQNSTRSLVMLAGGIGITPFLSMIRQAQHDNRAGEMFLFYSNRRLEDAPYFVELQQIAQNYPNLKFVPTMTDVTNSAQPWTGETGYITAEMLAKYLGDLNIPNFFIAGPPTMVFAIGQMLNKAGVIDDNVRTEDFAGY